MSDQLLDAIGEVKAELVRHSMTLEQVLRQTTVTNGRVSVLERWRQEVAVQDAKDRGRLEGAATAALTKGQLRALLAGVAAITSVSGAIVGIVVKVL